MSVKKAVAQKNAAKTQKAPAKTARAKKTSGRVVPPILEPVEKIWDITLAQVGKRLKDRNMDVSIVPDLVAARELVMKTLLPESGAQSVSFGGSMTLLQAGLPEAIKTYKGLTVLDTFDSTPPPQERLELRRQALLCDFYLCSVNALTKDGLLMLLDGTGNRTAAVQFGPRKVVLLVSRNKICSSVEEGYERIRNFAAPANTTRLKRKTPCVKTGRCMDCTSPERICSFWTIIERNSSFPGRIHVVLINEDAGY